LKNAPEGSERARRALEETSMRLNMLIGVPAPEKEPECKTPNIRTHPKNGTKPKGDPRTKLKATGALASARIDSYKVYSSNDQYVPHEPFDTMNPDVSGFTSRLCRSPPRNTSAGEESLKSAMQELRCGKR
jgi:hypothetical protein